MRKKIILGVCVLCIAVIVGIFVKLKTTKYEAVEISNVNLSTIADGIYEGSSETNFVKVKVVVTVKDNIIQDIVIKEHECGLGKKAEIIVDDIIEKQSLQVDSISGATMSSNVIKLAVEEALR